MNGPGGMYEGLAPKGRWSGEVRLIPEMLERPATWRKPRLVFAGSMSDLFHERLPDSAIRSVLETIRQNERHTFQVLTKRAERMMRFLDGAVPIPNLWLGVSVEDDRTAQERIPYLIDTPAVLRFVSYEPALGLVEWPSFAESLGWLIAGGESGPNARRPDVAWFRSARDYCQATATPFLFKQWGTWSEDGRKVGKHAAGRLLDGREWLEFPNRIHPDLVPPGGQRFTDEWFQAGRGAP